MPYWYSDPVDLGVETDGNYMVNVLGGTGINVVHVPAEGSTATVSLDATLDNLSNVTVPTPATNDILKWNGTAWVNGSSTLDSLSDVTVPSPVTGQLLRWNGTAWINNGIALDEVSDVTAPTPTLGDFLKWNGTAWVNDPSLGDVVTANRITAEVTNADSVTLVRGDVVYLFGATGNRASVKLASATGDITSSTTFGIVEDTIAPNNIGTVVTQGTIDQLTLTGYNPGDSVWLSSTAGDFTNVKPTAPVHTVFLGVVERANAGNGQIYVKVQNGYELGELHNVLTNGAGDGQALVYDADTSLWTHRHQSQALLMTDASAETVNRVLGAASSDTPATGVACLTMFRAQKTITVGNVSMITGASTSSGLTLARMGLYTIDSSGNATLVARTASDTTLFNSSTTLYTRAFATAGGYPATYKIQAGSMYALGVICVGSAGGNYQSTLILSASTVIGTLMAGSPRLVGNLNGQTDLPTTIASGSFVNRGRMHYGRFTA